LGLVTKLFTSLKKIIKYLELVTTYPGYLASGFIIPLTLAICYEVFARYLFGKPTIWAYEFGYLVMGFHFLLGGALTLQKQDHIRIDIFYNKLSTRKKSIVDFSLYLIFIVPCLSVLSFKLFQHTQNSFLSNETTGSSAWNPPIWPMHLIMFISFTILFLQVVSECIKSIILIKNSINK